MINSIKYIFWISWIILIEIFSKSQNTSPTWHDERHQLILSLEEMFGGWEMTKKKSSGTKNIYLYV